MKVGVVFAALALTACATTAAVQNKGAAFTVASPKTAGSLEECLSLKLSKFGTPSAIHGDGRTILSYGQPNPAFTLTIVDLGSTRSIEGRKGVVSPNTVRSMVDACI